MNENQQLTFWRTIAVCLLGVVFTLVGCVYSRDQNSVTKADLAPIAQSVNETQGKVNLMSQDLSYLQGELRAKRIIEK